MNKPGSAQDETARFLNIQKTLFLNFYHFLSAEKYPEEYA